MSKEFRPVLKSFVVALFAALLVLPFQGLRGLWEADEGRYACIALQMLRTGDFISPAF
jgi:4-amino-4-deoxy-L-arabinose transferase